MEFGIYVVYDRVAGSYGEPFVAQKEALAVRRFQYTMANAPMVKDDCELYAIGLYDTELGVIKAYEKPVFVSRTIEEAK